MARILQTIGIERSSSELAISVEQARKGGDANVPCDLVILVGRLQSTALQYLLHCEFEAGKRFKDARKILQHIAAANIDAAWTTFGDRLIPWDQFAPLRSTFDRIRQNAAQILESLPKRGALKKEARSVFVDDLADIYEEVTDRIASKVSKQPGPFERFVRAALEPIDPHALTNIGDVIDAVADKRRERAKNVGQPLKFPT